MNSDILLQLLLAAVAVALIILAIEYIVPKIYKALRSLRIWWRSGQWRLPDTIEFRKGAAITSGRPAGVRGLFLLVITDKGQEMVSAGSAVDLDQFWKTWTHLGGQVDGWIDDDTGEEIKLTDL